MTDQDEGTQLTPELQGRWSLVRRLRRLPIGQAERKAHCALVLRRLR